MARQRLRPETRDLLLSDDLAALEARAELVIEKRSEADERLKVFDTDRPEDQEEYDRADTDYEQLDDELIMIERRIEELEEDASFREMQEMRREYWSEIFR